MRCARHRIAHARAPVPSGPWSSREDDIGREYILSDVVGDACCGVFDGVSGEVGVAGGCLDLGVAEELRDHRQALAQRKRA